MRDAPLEHAAKLAGRVSGDSTVAYGIAFAQAVEAALALKVPQRALFLRALMAELERLANHFGDIGAICNDASFSLMHAHCGALRERVLRAADTCFGHRLMMDRVVPGGTAADLDDRGLSAIRALIAVVRREFPELVELYDNTASLQDRTVTTGIVKPELARQYGAGGYIGRASGRSFDARRTPGYAPYGELSFDVPVRSEGDVDARVWIRVREIEQSLALIEQITERLPPGPIRIDALAASRATGHARGSPWSKGFAATSWPGCGWGATGQSRALTCAILHGSNGRYWRRPSKATSSPTFLSATNPSTAPTRGTISESMRPCASFFSRAFCKPR